jgi:hypothetical protein
MSDTTDLATKRPAVVQFTLGSLFLAMTWVAIVCIGLNKPSRLWSDVIGFITILALLSAVLVATYG